MVMVGDAIHDMQMAMNAGAAGVGVTFGGGNPEVLRQGRPHAIASTVPELARVLGVVPEMNAELRRRGLPEISAQP
jgi:phosphoglycolate phosphatase-like HAD superfamily hydrolase